MRPFGWGKPSLGSYQPHVCQSAYTSGEDLLRGDFFHRKLWKTFTFSLSLIIPFPTFQNTLLICQSGQFSLLSSSLGPCTVQGAISQSPPSLTPGNAGPLNGIPSRDGGSSSTALQHIDHGEQNGSHGTLMLSKGGRSKYLGPTAGSEWLKDVSCLA